VVSTIASEKVTAFDPRGYPPKIVPKPMAPRLSTLDGKTIYLIDPHFDDSGLFMQQLQTVMASRLPSVKTRIVQMNGVYTQDDSITWEEIKANGDAAIIGVGH